MDLPRRRRSRSIDHFDPEFYVATNPDLADRDAELARAHWDAFGRDEGRIGSREQLEDLRRMLGELAAAFDAEIYLGHNPDLVAVGLVDPLAAEVHFLRCGVHEGRIASEADRLAHREVLGVRVPTIEEWEARIGGDRYVVDRPRSRFSAMGARLSSDSSPSPDHSRVAVLVSLHRTHDHLDRFLGNLVEQTSFDRCDICVVTVDPDDDEMELLRRFDSTFENVRLRVERERISVYRAWNLGLEMSDAPLITNANVDDLRRRDSFEVQARALDGSPSSDVVIQDVLLTIDPTAPWGVVERAGVRVTMPPVTAELLLGGFNAPHNAPMWRRSLHDGLGGFDETFESAGDWEFWIRCALAGRRFLHVEPSTVAYYVNEAGLSRRPGGPGHTEAATVVARHRDRLER